MGAAATLSGSGCGAKVTAADAGNVPGDTALASDELRAGRSAGLVAAYVGGGGGGAGANGGDTGETPGYIGRPRCMGSAPPGMNGGGGGRAPNGGGWLGRYIGGAPGDVVSYDGGLAWYCGGGDDADDAGLLVAAAAAAKRGTNGAAFGFTPCFDDMKFLQRKYYRCAQIISLFHFKRNATRTSIVSYFHHQTILPTVATGKWTRRTRTNLLGNDVSILATETLFVGVDSRGSPIIAEVLIQIRLRGHRQDHSAVVLVRSLVVVVASTAATR